MNNLPVIALKFDIERGMEFLEVVSDVPVRVFRIGEPSCPHHIWEMKETADPDRLAAMLTQAAQNMIPDTERLIRLLADAVRLMTEKYWED
jgi:hypothetical protein